MDKREQLYTQKQVAEFLGVAPTTVGKWLRMGLLTGIKVSNRWRIQEKDLDEFLKKATEKEEQERKRRKLSFANLGGGN